MEAPVNLAARARELLIELAFEPELPPAAAQQLASISGEAVANRPQTHDLRELLWSSIDNEESRDLDQIEFAERLPSGAIRLLVGIADVDALVLPDSALDQHARVNTTSLYAGVATFPMLPEKLSTDLTSLAQDQDRLALVTDMTVHESGEVAFGGVIHALVRNRAKLSYEEVGEWLERRRERPGCCRNVPGLEPQLSLQFEAAQKLAAFRKRAGALTFSGFEPKLTTKNGQVIDLKLSRHNPARDIIESFMLATNIALANFLKERGRSFIERVVRVPERWDRIRAIAAGFGARLPEMPDPKPLADFMAARQAADPLHYPDLSLSIVKLLGPGEYTLEGPGGENQGHFGLAVHDYTHSTAPNRRFADLIIQRLLKAVIAGTPAPYSADELREIAAHCTERENAARKFERRMRKIVAAASLQSRIGETFDGIITGATPKGTYVRLLQWPAEGRIVKNERGADVGDKVRVKLLRTEVKQGFIDFERV